MRVSLTILATAALTAEPTSALRVPTPALNVPTRRDALRLVLTAPLAGVALPRGASASSNLQQVILGLIGFDAQTAQGKAAARDPAELTEGEQMLLMRAQEMVERQEKAVGFKLDEADIAECVEMTRNKYCGKDGLGFTLSDGSRGTC